MRVYVDNLANHTTMQIGGRAAIVELDNENEVEDFFNNIESVANKHNINIKADLSNIRILGGGSNMLVGEEVKDIVFVRLTPTPLPASPTSGEGSLRDTNAIVFQTLPLGEGGTKQSVMTGEVGASGSNFSVWGGVNWDELVAYTVERGYKDLAYLSLIPGTVGAAPVQNIGAYGAEVKDTIMQVRGYDFVNRVWKVYLNKDCDFAYRHSRFQKEKSFLITRVSFEFPPSLGEGLGVRSIYPSLKNLINENSSALEIREAVIKVRDSKLPRIPNLTPALYRGEVVIQNTAPEGAIQNTAPSVGSFFHNPIVENEVAVRLKMTHEAMPIYEYDTQHKKLSAGWLIENSAAKNIENGIYHYYKQNHLVITHDGGAQLDSLLGYANEIKLKVKEKFNIELHIEPEIII